MIKKQICNLKKNAIRNTISELFFTLRIMINQNMLSAAVKNMFEQQSYMNIDDPAGIVNLAVVRNAFIVLRIIYIYRKIYDFHTAPRALEQDFSFKIVVSGS